MKFIRFVIDFLQKAIKMFMIFFFKICLFFTQQYRIDIL